MGWDVYRDGFVTFFESIGKIEITDEYLQVRSLDGYVFFSEYLKGKDADRLKDLFKKIIMLRKNKERHCCDLILRNLVNL